MLKTQALEPELDPYSRLISGSVERVGPGVAGKRARRAAARAARVPASSLTNSHVAQRADTALVSLSDGRTCEAVRVGDG